ncbi:type IV pilin protein [Inhella gelatinilytica]|uniref:Prepilin-type N-terminal cleavage/methylation domain-containing protein n=1 Tax=Inhella gelatinilytica TaxID=2795030 RepID=A0A931IYL4_9BURK|nr:type IV pilin protein [Inhella gelatinilytica]MBH9552988.1 prepilin-type N-terminal cleavage/methylation domain-containing protein [Inhella gelatinilytica]
MQRRTHKGRGVSLIELTVAMALGSTVAGMALPSWTAAAQKGRRADAHQLAQQIEAAQSAHYLQHRRYADALGLLQPYGVRAVSPRGHYEARLQSGDAQGYRLTIQALSSSPQSHDGTCASFHLVSTRGHLVHGAQAASGFDTQRECWPQ